MDYAGHGDESLWLSGTGNGHANSALGGTSDAALRTNIFDFSHGRPTPVEINDTDTKTPHNSLTSQVPDMAYMTEGGSADGRGGGYRSAYSTVFAGGYNPTVSGSYYAFNDYDWGATVDATTEDVGYHLFSCSKCHNPHASRLPKLMITNCLDVQHNTWDGPDGSTGRPGVVDNQSKYTASALLNVDRNSDGSAKEAAYFASAQNCHRYTRPETGTKTYTPSNPGGWNKVTPWDEPARHYP